MLSRFHPLEVAGLLVVCATLMPELAVAQITPDATLGAESSRVRPGAALRRGGTADLIEGGATRGANLFHSFSEFNVNDGQRVYFANPDGIANILSRITGTDVSDINGTLGVDGAANLFLLNPNGFNFGPNARLDVLGSFMATTGNDFLFPDGSAFGTSNPQAPLLLTVSVPVGVQYGGRVPGAIVVDGAILFVDSGKSLVLAGGTIRLDNALLETIELATGNFPADGGRVELGAASAGTVGINQNGGQFSLSFPNSTLRSDISIVNGSSIDVRAEDKGAISVYARNLEMLSGGRLRAGVRTGGGFVDSQVNDIRIDATSSVQIQNSELLNLIEAGATGNSGNVIVVADSLSLLNGATIQTPVRQAANGQPAGRGQAGNIDIAVDNDLTLAGRNQSDRFSALNSSLESGATGGAGNVTVRAGSIRLDDAGIFSEVQSRAFGNGGTVTVTADSLSLSNGSQLSTSVLGTQGQAGDITLRINGVTELVGQDRNRVPSSLFSSLGTGSVGRAGNIDIRTGALSMQSGTRLNSSTFGQGNAGNVAVTVNGAAQLDNADIFSRVEAGAVGDGGDVTVHAGSMSLLNGSWVQTAVRQADDEGQPAGRGQAGDILITVDDDLTLAGRDQGGDFSRLDSSLESRARGGAGNVTVRAGRIQLDDAAIFSTVDSEAVGNGGNIDIQTSTLSAQNDTELNSSTSGQGNAGSVTVRASRIRLDDSRIFSSVSAGGVGNGGAVTIRAGRIQLDDAAIFSTVDSGAVGDGGNVRILADSASLRRGSQILTLVAEDGRGQAGNIVLEISRDLNLEGVNQDNFPSAINSDNNGRGETGNIRLDSPGSTILRRGSRISAFAAEGSEGVLKA